MTCDQTPPMAEPFTVRSWIAAFGPMLAKALANGDVHEPVKVTAISRSDTCLVFAIELAAQRYLVKAFNPRDPKSHDMVTREITCLSRLQDSSLVPGIVLANTDHRFLVTAFIEGPRLVDRLLPASLDAATFQLGAWFARYTAAMPVKTAETNWFDYLSGYDAGMAGEVICNARSFLSSAKISRRSIAKNDAFLGNFLWLENGGLIGIDFETAAFKPYGWDILDTARVLAKRFPQRSEDVVNGLIRGWGQGTDRLSRAEFARLARCFVKATA